MLLFSPHLQRKESMKNYQPLTIKSIILFLIGIVILHPRVDVQAQTTSHNIPVEVKDNVPDTPQLL